MKTQTADARFPQPRIRFRKASDVLSAHYREKAAGRSDAVRPPGVLLGGLLWVDMTEVVRDDDAAWNTALDEARRSVVANFEEIGRGLFVARFQDPVAGVPLLFPETLVGLAQNVFCVCPSPAGQIDHRKQQVTELMLSLFDSYGSSELSNFLEQLIKHTRYVVPLEPGFADSVLHQLGVRQGW